MPKVQESLRSVHYIQYDQNILNLDRQNTLILGILGTLGILGILIREVLKQ